MEVNYLGFNSLIGKSKPENIIHKDVPCPFCDVDKLTNIIDRQDNIILLENKYRVIEKSYQLVIIETDQCNSDIPEYSREHMQKLIRFGVKHWLEAWDSGKFQSVLFFKNHGRFSGGTIRHPHMQIVGLYDLDYTNIYDGTFFQGYSLAQKNSVEIILSTKPRIGFTEINVLMKDLSDIDIFAISLQCGVDYVINHFHTNCNSYNLFFYKLEEGICVKILPRFATSPLFIGYNIALIPNNLAEIAADFKERYRDKMNTYSVEGLFSS